MRSQPRLDVVSHRYLSDQTIHDTALTVPTTGLFVQPGETGCETVFSRGDCGPSRRAADERAAGQAMNLLEADERYPRHIGGSRRHFNVAGAPSPPRSA